MLQEAVDSVCVAAPRLDRVSLQIVEAGGGRQQNVAIGAPVKAPHKGLILNIVEEQSVRGSPLSLHRWLLSSICYCCFGSWRSLYNLCSIACCVDHDLSWWFLVHCGVLSRDFRLDSGCCLRRIGGLDLNVSSGLLCSSRLHISH